MTEARGQRIVLQNDEIMFTRVTVTVVTVKGCESPTKQLSQLSLSLLPRCRVVARKLPKCTECLDVIDIQ